MSATVSSAGAAGESAEAPKTPPAEPDHLRLAADFPGATREQWRELASGVLAKSGAADGDADSGAADPEDALSFTTYDGIRIRPLYTADDAHDVDADGLPGHPPFVRGASADDGEEASTGWDVRTRHADVDAQRVNAAVLADLERGATSLWIVLGDAGLALDDLPAALEGVLLDLAPIVLDAGPQTVEAADALLAMAEQQNVDLAKLAGSFGADPIGSLARTGAPADLDLLAALVPLRERAPGMCLATVDATVFHDAGASDAQEIGLATAVGVAYLRALTDRAGLSVDEALAALEFRWAVTAEQFASITKLRAARRVWDRVAELCGAGSDGADGRRGQRQHAVTSAAMLTRRDAWVNMLRTTIGCFAAAVGGAAAITVTPFDAAIGRSDDFARRIARNTQAVLHDESSLARVTDAAGGSWYVESLTDTLADAAWTVFTDVEKNGGVLTRLEDGTVATFLAATHDARTDDIAHRRVPITGISEYPFVGEDPVERPRLPDVDTDGALLPPVRWAQGYEALRDRADAAAQRPKVFLATLGSLPQHSARTGFATNLFAAGGIETITGTPDEFADAGTSAACICGPDDLYADEADTTAETLRAAGAELIWLAGKYEAKDVDGNLHKGSNALEALERTHAVLEQSS